MKKLLIALMALIALPAAAAEPGNPSYVEQWARTPVTVPSPRGLGCMVYAAAAATATPLRDANANYAVFTLPVQYLIVNTATSAVTVCNTQDVDATIDRVGRFSVEDDATRYAAGPGSCVIVGAGGTAFHGAFNQTFAQTSGSWTVGSNARSCTGTGAPCEVTANCQTGACTGGKTAKTYVSIVNAAGSGSGDVYICEIE
jgi:hypothetical protein